MEPYGRSVLQQNPDTQTGLEESMSRLGLRGREAYPERPGVPDCAYYMRTGSCGYGTKCRFNHPCHRGAAEGVGSMGGTDYPERLGEPDCQYYIRTGTCKFGKSCKFHHPRNAAGLLINVQLNINGYPLRPAEKECSYYLKTGQCKFGITCKFNHPQPAGISLPATARPFYPTVQSPSAPSLEQFGGASASYRVPRPALLTSSYVPGAYGPMLLHTGVVQIPNWSSYPGAINHAFSPGAQASLETSSFYGVSQLASSAPAFAGSYPSLLSSSSPSASNLKEERFPERPGQPECQYYIKNGDCKFGSSCKYHHPPGWVVTKTCCLLSPLGLPLRPGVQSCTFYLQKGSCKFGRNCKFDHPMGTIQYSPSTSSLADVPVAPYMLSPSVTARVPTVSPELLSGLKLDPHVTHDRPHKNSLSSSVGLMYSGTGAFWLSSVQISNQSSNSNTGRSTREEDIEVHHLD